MNDMADPKNQIPEETPTIIVQGGFTQPDRDMLVTALSNQTVIMRILALLMEKAMTEAKYIGAIEQIQSCLNGTQAVQQSSFSSRRDEMTKAGLSK